MPIQLSSSPGFDGARNVTFQAVFALSLVVPAVDSCVIFATRSYVVDVGASPGIGSTTVIKEDRLSDQPMKVERSLQSRRSSPFKGKLIIVGFFSSTNRFLVNRL